MSFNILRMTFTKIENWDVEIPRWLEISPFHYKHPLFLMIFHNKKFQYKQIFMWNGMQRRQELMEKLLKSFFFF